MAQDTGKSIARIAIISIFFLGIVGYSLFQAHKLISGPIIQITSPKNGSTLTQNLVEIKGVAKNTSFISMNDRPIYIDEQGNFSEKLPIYPGYTIINLKAKDRFGSLITKNIEVSYKVQ
ncbi:MAG: hypothetical protein PHF79_00885 [Candidatus Pacebacteria bacterium]|nr:hypothetical protein [Candidatus Paceibacterota bacterium]